MYMEEFHKLCINNEINDLSKYDKTLYFMSDYNGNSSVHICALYNNYKLLSKIIDKYPETMKLINKYQETAMHIIANDKIEELKNIINNTHISQLPDDIINIALDKTDDEKTIKLIAQKTNLNNGSNPALQHYLRSDMINLKIINILIDAGADVNGLDKNSMSPLIIAVNKKLDIKIINLLLEHGADINYAANGDMFLPLNVAINKGLIDVAEIILPETNMLHRDNNFNTPLHNAIINKNKINSKLLNEIIKLSDVNVPNINGQTALHLLSRSGDIKNYIDSLKHKELDLFAEDKSANTPASSMSNEIYINLLNNTANFFLADKSTDTIKKIIRCKDYAKLEQCRSIVKSQLLSKSDDTTNINSNFSLPETVKTNTTLFNSDVIHNIIYLIQIIRKYPNVFIPHQEFIPDKCMNTIRNLSELSLYRTEYGEIIHDLLKLYAQDFFEFMPHLILWRSPNINYSYPDLQYYTKKILNNDKIRFIIFKLSLLPFSHMTHANIIIYDKKTNHVERFEPYGNTVFLMKDLDKLDVYLKKLFKKIINPDTVYIGPKDYMSNAKFQLISKETDPDYKKLGDPTGFCLAWSYWFVELRLQNPDTPIEDLVDNALSEIINSGETILSYIRNYSKKLDNYKNEFLTEIGVEDDDKYIISYNGKRGEIIFDGIIKGFQKLKR